VFSSSLLCIGKLPIAYARRLETFLTDEQSVHLMWGSESSGCSSVFMLFSCSLLLFLVYYFCNLFAQRNATHFLYSLLHKRRALLFSWNGISYKLPYINSW
jgi:hypothetical protein